MQTRAFDVRDSPPGDTLDSRLMLNGIPLSSRCGWQPRPCNGYRESKCTIWVSYRCMPHNPPMAEGELLMEKGNVVIEG